MRAGRAAIVLLTFALTQPGCSDPSGVNVPGARETRPPAVYAQWWAETEACSSLSGDFGSVRWYVAGGYEFHVGGEAFQGLYLPPVHAIVLAGDVVNDALIVRHEMLHALLRTAGHPPSYFIDRCGGVVHCAPICHLRP